MFMMNAKRLAALALLIVATGGVIGVAQNPGAKPTREFMRDKLELSQKILEGLAMENFEVMGTASRRLNAMSQEAAWQAFDNPDYAQLSAGFRKNVEALTKAAKSKNLDGATLAYVRVTISCVECHKYVRGKLVAATETPGPPAGY